MLEEGWRRRRWRQERKDRGKNGRSLTHEMILFILFTTPQRTLLSFREISAFFFFFFFVLSASILHFIFILSLSYLLEMCLVSTRVKTLLLISIAFPQKFTPFRVRDDTVLHFKLPLSRTPLIHMLLSFHLHIFSSLHPLQSSLYVILSISGQCNKGYPSKTLFQRPYHPVLLLLCSSRSFHPCAPSCESCWQKLGGVCSVCASRPDCFPEVLWRRDRWAPAYPQPSLLDQRCLLMDVSPSASFPAQMGLSLDCASERTIPGNSQLFGGSSIVEELLTHFKWLH